MSVAKTFRLDEDLVLRFEARARELGQSQTVFVSRALEEVLGARRDPDGGGVVDGQIVPTAPSRAPDARRAEYVAPIREHFETAVQRRIRLAEERQAIARAAVDRAMPS